MIKSKAIKLLVDFFMLKVWFKKSLYLLEGPSTLPAKRMFTKYYVKTSAHERSIMTMLSATTLCASVRWQLGNAAQDPLKSQLSSGKLVCEDEGRFNSIKVI